MSGAVEEGAKVASGVVSALSNNPLVLSLVVFNCLFIAAVVYGSYENRKTNAILTEKFLEQQNKAMEMLYKCIPQEKADLTPLPRERPAELGPPHITPDEVPL
jgi:hypothetical protein